MELKHLISFETVARLQSYTQAADSLYLTQPAVTAHINHLEAELQTALFIKNKLPVQLTDSGRILLTYSRKIFQLTESAKREIDNLRLGFTGELAISASASTVIFLVNFLNQFKRQHSQVALNFTVAFAHETITKILNEEAQIGIIKKSMANYQHPLLTSEYLFEDNAILVFCPSHPLARYSELSKKKIIDNRTSIVIFGSQTDFKEQIINQFEASLIDLEAGIGIDHSETLVTFLKQSNHIAFMPRSLVHKELEKGDLVTRQITDLPPIRRYAFIITKKAVPPTSLVLLFKEELTNFLLHKKTNLISEAAEKLIK
ncbi:LysR family transcriptional regulator [uncultured Vagococcus sp.]|uniref:LysR family transcriptional regulator n=1 Tax=uncultured Vagococcus sp. TaxID=189676 RepID=UPI0028D85DF4|nr:LysR family transcriptional regulator [uncultured Vagococcus sp.]